MSAAEHTKHRRPRSGEYFVSRYGKLQMTGSPGVGICLETMSLWANLNLNNIVANRIEHQLAQGVDSQFAHDVRAGCFYCAYA